MNSLVCSVLLAAAVVAEPPRSGRTGLAPASQENAPYPAAGFRPAVAFELPARQDLSPPPTSYGVPATSYGAPLNTYVAPAPEYGPPDASAKSARPEEDLESVTQGPEAVEKSERQQELKEEQADAAGTGRAPAYYVLLPSARLQLYTAPAAPAALLQLL